MCFRKFALLWLMVLEEETRGHTHTHVNTYAHVCGCSEPCCLFSLAVSAENLAELQDCVLKVDVIKGK